MKSETQHAYVTNFWITFYTVITPLVVKLADRANFKILCHKLHCGGHKRVRFRYTYL